MGLLSYLQCFIGQAGRPRPVVTAVSLPMSSHPDCAPALFSRLTRARHWITISMLAILFYAGVAVALPRQEEEIRWK
jgi:hypothetical protein